MAGSSSSLNYPTDRNSNFAMKQSALVLPFTKYSRINDTFFETLTVEVKKVEAKVDSDSVYCRHNFSNYYELRFTEPDGSFGTIDYNLDGIVLRTIRYYTASQLSPFIKAKVQEKYPGKIIYAVTELSSNYEFTYHIILEDATHLYKIVSDGTGNITLEKKLQLAKK